MDFLLGFISPEDMLKLGMSLGAGVLLWKRTEEGLELMADELQANKTIDLEDDYGYIIWSSDGYDGWYSGAFGGRDGEWSPFD